MTTTTTAQILIVDELNGVPRYRCPDCGRWEYSTAKPLKIRHSKRCDLGHLQPQGTEVAPPAPTTRETREQYIQRLADAGEQIQPCDWDAAMNRDD